MLTASRLVSVLFVIASVGMAQAQEPPALPDATPPLGALGAPDQAGVLPAPPLGAFTDEHFPERNPPLVAGTVILPADPENCLSCHRFRGLSRLDKETGELRLFFCSARYYANMEGPHSRLMCTGCHERQEVRSIPHEEVAPVDCSRSCHLMQATGGVIKFSHASLSERVGQSVHQVDGMSEITFAEKLLGAGQSPCLYCHDQPVFREPSEADPSHRGEELVGRCNTCHTEELPVDVDYYLHHTAGRVHPARPVRETARACAVCHSNTQFNSDEDLHDSVASYFSSFHGKASLLGSTETATCIDCHASDAGDAHLMLSAADPASPTHPDNLETTCRTSQCHASAVPELSAAAVHLRINPDVPTAEYVLTVAFVALNVIVLGTYFALVLLELLSSVLRRHGSEHRAMVALAKAVQASPAGRLAVMRLNVHQRVQHWLLVLFFTVLVLTGMPLKFASHPAMESFTWVFGGVSGARQVHRAAGLLLCIGFAYHIGSLLVQLIIRARRRRQGDPSRSLVRHAAQEILDFPLFPNFRDIRNFGQLYGYLLGARTERPHHGRFHFTQKAEYWAVCWGMVVIGVSGAMLWSAAWMSDFYGGRALNFALIVHSFEAFLAFLSIAVLHLYAVIFSPSVFPLNPASLNGELPAAELAESHAGHLVEVAEELGITAVAEPVRHPTLSRLGDALRRLYALAMLLAVGWLCWTSMQFLTEQLIQPDSRPADVQRLPVRLDAEALHTSPTDAEDHTGARERRWERGPLSHFHVIPSWFSPDPANGCTTSGCHEPLPHGERKEDRAFLNMHATFVDCSICHLEGAARIGDISWVSLSDRSRRDAPAIIRLVSFLETAGQGDEASLEASDVELKLLLQQALEESRGDREVAGWVTAIDTAPVGTPRYRMALDKIRGEIGLHGHGEYGAKVGIPAGAPRAWSMNDAQRTAAATLTSETELTEEARQAAVDVVHEGVVRSEVPCTGCHKEQSEIIDFDALGYSARHSEALRTSLVARQSQDIEEGRTFYIPTLLEGERFGDESPSEQQSGPSLLGTGHDDDAGSVPEE